MESRYIERDGVKYYANGHTKGIIHTNGDGTNISLETKIEPLKGTAAPTTVPVFLGQEYLDTTNKKMYKAFGKTASTDWVLLN